MGLVTDAPYLRYDNHKMKRQALVPIDEQLHALIVEQQARAGDAPVLFPRPTKNPDTRYRRPIAEWATTAQHYHAAIPTLTSAESWDRGARDGQAVAEIVPAPSAPATNERALAIERRQAECFGAPTLADYRKVYETSGWLWPGDDVIRRDYLVGDAC